VPGPGEFIFKLSVLVLIRKDQPLPLNVEFKVYFPGPGAPPVYTYIGPPIAIFS